MNNAPNHQNTVAAASRGPSSTKRTADRRSRRRGALDCASVVAACASLTLAGQASGDWHNPPPNLPPIHNAFVMPDPWMFFAQNPEVELRVSEHVRPDLTGDGIEDFLFVISDYNADEPAMGSVVARSGWYLTPGAMYELSSGEANDLFGFAHAVAPDMTGNGRKNLVVGAPLSVQQGVPQAGRVYIYDAANGALRATITGSEQNGGFGYSIASVGDLNGDSLADVVIGQPGDAPSQFGKAFVFYGRALEGGVPLQLTTADADLVLVSPEPGDAFGFTVASGMDLTGDGVPDFVVGAPLSVTDEEDPLFRSGAAYVYSGATGALIATIRGDGPYTALGASLLLIEDMTGDGRAGLLVGAPSVPHVPLNPDVLKPGRVFRFTGEAVSFQPGPVSLTPTHAATVLAATEPGHVMYGASIELGRDVTGDGVPEVLVSSTKAVPMTAQEVEDNELDPDVTWFNVKGHTTVHNGAVLTPLYTYETGEGSDIEHTTPWVPPLPAQLSGPFSMLEFGDVNGDFLVDASDLVTVISLLGRDDLPALVADVNGDGVIDFDDIEIVITNMGMTAAAGARAKCETIVLGGSPGEPGNPGIYGPVIVETCECIFGQLASAGITVDGDPCEELDPDGPGGGDPGNPGGPGGDCDGIEPTNAEECAELASCKSWEEFGDEYEELQNMLTEEGFAEAFPELWAQYQALMALEDAYMDAHRAVAVAIVNAMGEVKARTQAKLNRIDNRITRNSIGSAVVVGVIGGALTGLYTANPVVVLFGAVVGGAVGGVGWLLTDGEEAILDKTDILDAQVDAAQEIEMAANGNPNATRPVDHGTGAVVNGTNWNTLVSAGNLFNGARQAYEAICDQLNALRDQIALIKEAIQDQLDALQTLIDAYVAAVMACCMDMLDGGTCDPHTLEPVPN